MPHASSVMKHLSLSLRENARSFLEDALANAISAEQNPARWKFAILSMVQAIELSLKQLLFEVHPLFVYENVDKPTRTVGLDLAVKRLASLGKLSLTPDERRALDLAKEARDQITHYEVDQEVEHLKLSFSRLLGFLTDFYDSHFASRLYDEIDRNLWANGVAIKAYGQQLHERAMKRAEAEIDKELESLIVCPACSWRPMLVREDGDATCLVCGHRAEIGFCHYCDEPHPIDDMKEAGGKRFCESCLDHVTSDYWSEQRANK
jgi:hypothetical protein